MNVGVKACNKHGGSPILVPGKVDESYLLIAPFNTGDYKNNGGSVYLTNLFGELLHRWDTIHQTANAKLTKDRHLYVTQVAPESKDTAHFPGGGRNGIIQKLDWEGNVVWQYNNDATHHDFEVMPNGNILVVVWEPLNKTLAKKILKNVIGRVKEETMWADAILEIDSAGETIWEWHAKDHLVPEKHFFGQYPYRVEWTHTNAVRHLESNPINSKESLLVSMRNASRVFLIDKESGKILWESPEGMLAGQHDPTMLTNGNILVFDNGLHRLPSSRSEVVNSRVIEINPHTNEIEWTLDGGKTSSEKARLYSSIMCGAQRLKNGNTHITLSSSGHFFEVTPDKELVWDFINPFATEGASLWPNNAVFVSRRYTPESIDFPDNFEPPIL